MTSTKHLCREGGTAAVSAAPASPPTVPIFESRSLLGTAREIVIRHGGECYRLSVTRQNKLILTK